VQEKVARTTISCNRDEEQTRARFTDLTASTALNLLGCYNRFYICNTSITK